CRRQPRRLPPTGRQSLARGPHLDAARIDDVVVITARLLEVEGVLQSIQGDRPPVAAEALVVARAGTADERADRASAAAVDGDRVLAVVAAPRRRRPLEVNAMP